MHIPCTSNANAIQIQCTSHAHPRPNARGVLELTSESELWSEVRLPPSRGIKLVTAQERLKKLAEWLERGERAPRPEWEKLDGGFALEALDNMEEPEPEDLINFQYYGLDLDERQK